MGDKRFNDDNDPLVMARKARRDIRITGKTDVTCPKCGTAPVITVTERGERTIVSCDCGYVHDVDINF